MTNIPKTFDQMDQWKAVMFLYNSALKEINTKIEILNNEFIHIYSYTPIEAEDTGEHSQEAEA